MLDAIVQRGRAGCDAAQVRGADRGTCAGFGVSLAPGRFGYWLDLGLAMLAVYVAGCAIGSWLRNLVVSRPAPAADA
jgi:hypothetical protein